jgi:ABC-type transport system substrate-binding protein
MKVIFILKLLTVFLVAFSLLTLSGPITRNPDTPTIQLAHANTQACQTHGGSGACSEFWYPAGPTMDTLFATIFTDENAEYTCLQAATPCIDFTDWPASSSVLPGLTTNPNFLVSAPVSSHSYFEIEFMLANNFWGVNFNYGNDPNGIQIRQGISHLIDKAEFVAAEPALGAGSPIDNPLPPSNGGLASPNPCAWDTAFPKSGTACVVGSPGGTAYHISSAAGVNFVWQPALGSPDFCAAAQHFINAGLATGKDPSTCVLTGIASTVSAHTVNFFVRSDDPARLDLGNSISQEICALFGQGFQTSCLPYLNNIPGPITAFPGFTTSTTSVNLNWGMYTAGFQAVYPFDSSLYFEYNSRFVSGISSIQPPSGICSPQSVPSASASNYMYFCNTAYDNMTSRMEFSPCVNAVGDPSLGSQNNGPGGVCSGTTKLSAISAGIQAEDLFGRGAYTIPIYTTSQQFAYLNGWTRAVNNDGLGVPNVFTWLNAYNPAPAQPGTIRQGFKQSTRSLNPYIASTAWDFYILNSVYDSLDVPNPLSSSQIMSWMSITIVQLSNSALGYTPPAGTVSSYRVTLRPDLYWHDGTQVSPWDVKFTMQTLKATGAFQGSVLAPLAGVTVIGRHQFDVNVNAVGPFTLASLTSVTVIPGRYWSVCAGSLWDGYVASGSVPDSCIIAHPNKITATYDPLANGILVGSGAWECKSSTGVVGIGCSSSGTQSPPNPGGSFFLTRFGKGFAPASSTSGIYFRSSGDLALYAWTQENDINPIQAVSAVSVCFGQPFNPSGACSHWQRGIGASTTGVVGINQVAAVELRYDLNWVNPFEWALSPPLGIGSVTPILYEGSVTLNPCTVDPTNGYDC